MKEKYKLYSIFGILALAILSVVAFLILPLLVEINHDSADLFLAKNNDAVLEVQSDQVQNFKNQYGGYKENLAKIDQLFVDPQDPVNFIKFLETSASADGLALKITLVPGDQSQHQTEITVQLSSTGDFTRVVSFLEAIESGPYLLQINNVAMRASQNGTDALNRPHRKVDVDISLKVFTNPQEIVQ